MIADHERPCDPTVATLAIVTSLERVSGPSRRVKQLLPVRMLSLTDDRRSCRWRIVRQQPRHKHLTDAPTLQRPAKLPPKLRSRSRMRLIGDRGNDHRTRRHRQGRALSTDYRAGARFSGKGTSVKCTPEMLQRWSRCGRGNHPGRRRRPTDRPRMQMCEIAATAPLVIGYRTARMLTGGWLPRDGRRRTAGHFGFGRQTSHVVLLVGRAVRRIYR